MRLDQLIRQITHGRDYPTYSRRAGGIPSPGRFNALGAPPKDNELFTTPWRTVGCMKESVEVDTVYGIAKGLAIPPRAVWLAVGESCGLPVADYPADVATITAIAAGLTPDRRAILRSVADGLAADQKPAKARRHQMTGQ